jgi:hypothetical protein
MALLWCDGFDHYGVSATPMLAGPYAEVNGSGTVPSTTQIRTGSHGLRFPGGITTYASRPYVRRLFGADKTVVGVGFGLYMPEVPDTNNRLGWEMRDNANAVMLTFQIQSDASIEVFRGTASGTSIGRSGQVLGAQSWNHVEMRANRDASSGSVELRVNGLTVLDIADENTGANDFAGMQIGSVRPPSATVETFEMFIDDLFAWDSAGSENADFIGPLGVYTLRPDGDTAQADWDVTGSGSGFGAIDDAAPDDDSTYIGADTAGDISEFALSDLPGGISQIAGVVAVGYMRKTDAGSGNVQMSLVSSAVGSPPSPAVAAGADRPLTEVYTYWQDVFELDPATGGSWTPSAVNAALLRLDRTA